MDIITNHMKEVFLDLVGIRLRMITIRTYASLCEGEHKKNVSQIKHSIDSVVFQVTTNPGPGTYAAIGIKADGVYAPSNHARTKTPKIQRRTDERPKKHDRVPYLGKYAPGPGWYDHSAGTMVT